MGTDQLVLELRDQVMRGPTILCKYQRKIAFIKDLPNMISGNILRLELRSQEDINLRKCSGVRNEKRR